MKIFAGVLLALSLMAFWISRASAAAISLLEWGFNVDGSVYNAFQAPLSGQLPTSIDTSGFDWNAGLGIIAITISSPGSHHVLSFFDHEIDQDVNGFVNEIGSPAGSLAPGQSWQIGEPGYTHGTVYNNFLNNILNNNNENSEADDVSMALGWDFVLSQGQTAVITFILSDTMLPSAPFYLTQSDPDSFPSVPFSQVCFLEALDIVPTPVPEPSTIVLLCAGLACLALKQIIVFCRF